MARNSSGTHTLPVTLTNGTLADATQVMSDLSDLSTEITDSLSRSGKGGMNAELAMGSFKITGLADPTDPQDAATMAWSEANQVVPPAIIQSIGTNFGSAADKGVYTTAANTAAEFDLTSAGRAILDDASAAAQLVTLGLTGDQGEIFYVGASGVLGILDVGTSGQNLRTRGSGANPTWDWVGAPHAVFEDRKGTGVDGGTFTSGAWRTRDLNLTVRNFNNFATLTTNQITLPAGSYYFSWSTPAYLVGSHQSRLRNATDGTFSYGTTERTDVDVMTRSVGSCVETLAASKVFDLQHRCVTTRATDGFGVGAGFGNDVVYARLEIWRV